MSKHRVPIGNIESASISSLTGRLVANTLIDENGGLDWSRMMGNGVLLSNCIGSMIIRHFSGRDDTPLPAISSLDHVSCDIISSGIRWTSIYQDHLIHNRNTSFLQCNPDQIPFRHRGISLVLPTLSDRDSENLASDMAFMAEHGIEVREVTCILQWGERITNIIGIPVSTIVEAESYTGFMALNRTRIDILND